jgi:hypothetical protein
MRMMGDMIRSTCAAMLVMLYAVTIFGMASSASASADLVWQKCLGGSSYDWAYSVQQTSDGGYIVAGGTESNLTGDVGRNHGGEDFWVVKLDECGDVIWQKCLGGSSNDVVYGNIQQTFDGGYIVAGWTVSNLTGDVGRNHGGADCWVVKLDGSGEITWQKCLGGNSDDYALSVQQTSYGGYIIAGGTESNLTGDVGQNHGGEDYWVVKLDPSGDIAWQKCLGGSSWEYAVGIQQTFDSGYIVAGLTESNLTGDVGRNHGFIDYWVVKLDGSGEIIWQKCLGGSSIDDAESVQQTADGGYIVAGMTISNLTGDVGQNHGLFDYWIVKLGLDTRSMESYEGLLRSQFGLMGSFENLLKNTTLNSTMSYKFLDSFDDLADRQQRGLYSFEDLVSYSWSDLDACQKIKLTDSFEDLLRRQAAIIASNEDLLKRDFCELGSEDKKRLLDRFEDRLKFEVVLLKKFEDWLHYQQMMEETEYDSWIAFLSSFEDLLRRQSNLLDSFEMLMKIDCTEEYITVTKSAEPQHIDLAAGNQVSYTFTVKNMNNIYSIKDIAVKDSLWGDVGTIALLAPGASQTLTLEKGPSCADCNNCQCKVCDFATACGEVTTPNGNFTVCDVSNEVCVAVDENYGTAPIYPGEKVATVKEEQATIIEPTESSAKPVREDGVPVTIYFNIKPGLSFEPEGFDVYVDGKFIGRCSSDSFSFTVTAGHHVIRVNDGRHDYQQNLIFQSGMRKIIYVNVE